MIEVTQGQQHVGVGEKAGDLLRFDPKEFVESLFE